MPVDLCRSKSGRVKKHLSPPLPFVSAVAGVADGTDAPGRGENPSPSYLDLGDDDRRKCAKKIEGMTKQKQKLSLLADRARPVIFRESF